MSKIVVKFTKGWGKYNAKDIAGFDRKVSEDLIEVKKVAKLHNGGKVKGATVNLTLDTSEVDKRIAEATVEFTAKHDELDQAAAALDEREEDLDKREAELSVLKGDLDARETALVEREKAVKDSDPEPTTDKKPSGKPPKQGTK